MTLDPNTDRIVKKAIEPLIKRIKKLEAEIKKLKDRPLKVIYSNKEEYI